jgi:hypothetical protein
MKETNSRRGTPVVRKKDMIASRLSGANGFAGLVKQNDLGIQKEIEEDAEEDDSSKVPDQAEKPEAAPVLLEPNNESI